MAFLSELRSRVTAELTPAATVATPGLASVPTAAVRNELQSLVTALQKSVQARNNIHTVHI